MAPFESALVVGLGALGSAAAVTLASAGARRIVLVDGFRVEAFDLGHAPLFLEADQGSSRASAAAARLRALFPEVEAVSEEQPLEPVSALRLVRGTSVVLACSDDLAVQFLTGDAALRVGVPLVAGGVQRATVQVLSVRPDGSGGCLRCLFEAPAAPGTVPSAFELGVLGPAAALCGALVGAEALRLITGERGAYEGRLVTFEGRSARSRVVSVPRRPGCPTCAGVQPLEGPRKDAAQEVGEVA